MLGLLVLRTSRNRKAAVPIIGRLLAHFFQLDGFILKSVR